MWICENKEVKNAYLGIQLLTLKKLTAQIYALHFSAVFLCQLLVYKE